MLPKNRRIGRKEFPEILSAGKRYHSSHLMAFILLSKDTNLSRFSFSVSKKVAKLATSRNKMRRRGYAVVSKHIKSIKSGHLCFFSYKKDSSAMPYSLLEREIIEILTSASLLS